MNCILEKYRLTLLLTFLVFVVVSCQKGGEPVPYDGNSSHVTCEESENSSLRVGEIGFYDENTGGPVLDPGGTGTGGGTGGGTGTGGETVVGGDDNEDDDDDGVGSGNNGGNGGNGG